MQEGLGQLRREGEERRERGALRLAGDVVGRAVLRYFPISRFTIITPPAYAPLGE